MKYRTVTLVYIIISALFSGTAIAQKYSAYVNAGEKALNEGRYYAAIQYFQKALEFENQDERLFYQMAEASRLFNDYYPASYYYNQTILNDKDNLYPLALYWLAMMNKMQGEYEPAKNLFYRYYTTHQPDSDYYSIRAGHEVAACEEAYQMMKDTLPVKVKNLGNRVNSVYSDFGAQLSGDSLLHYSSLRFEVENEKTGKPEAFVTRILKSESRNGRYSTPLPLDTSFNTGTLHNGNSAFSSDRRVMIFSRCEPVNYSTLRCDLYISWNEKGRWSAPVRLDDPVNMPGTTSSQPAIGKRGAAGYTLYFVSDREGGAGKLDLYRCAFTVNGEFTEPINLGPGINSVDDDITPFFHNSSQTLYFSSDRYAGLGGYDIFSTTLAADTFSLPENQGYPLNTSYHDLYFTMSEAKDAGLLSSNRPGSMYIKSRTCCYDIYAYEFPEEKEETVMPADTAEAAPIVVARQLLPLELYFHNDEPDPKTMLTETRWNYKELYEAYVAMKPEYLQQYSLGLDPQKAGSAKKSIDKLFTQKITRSYNRLNRFARLLLEELNDGKKVKITVRGQASPLAKPDYNVNLSKRRISSFVNFLVAYEDGAIREFLDQGLLSVEEVGAGESLAKQFVSDDLQDKRNSVYSPAAALERKIEVIGVQADPAAN